MHRSCRQGPARRDLRGRCDYGRKTEKVLAIRSTEYRSNAEARTNLAHSRRGAGNVWKLKFARLDWKSYGEWKRGRAEG